MSEVVDAHRIFLSDAARVNAYSQAIAESVKPGDVVLDLGAGTGILGLLACRAGAKRVYSIEQGGLIELARAVARANDYEDRVHFIKEVSTRAALPEKVDVIVCDQIGRFGFEAGILQYLEDARRRFLKPGGITVPQRVDLYVAPVESEALRSQIEFWNGAPAGFDYRPARQWASNMGYPTDFAPGQLLSEPAHLHALDMSSATTASFSAEACAHATRPGVMHGVAGWFTAQLSPGVSMTNSPLDAGRINRRAVFFPIDRPVSLEPADCVRVQMHVIPAESVVTWTVEVRAPHAHGRGAADAAANGVKGRFTHSTLNGMLLCKEDLRRTQPAYVPTLTPWGVARRSVLELCDGNRPLGEIERQLQGRHPNLFPSLKDAAVFVAEVVTRYSV